MHDTEQSRRDIDERFGSYRKPTEKTIPKFKALQQKALEMAHLIDELCPNCREKSTALTKLQEAKMHANASIALNEGELV